MLGQGGTLWIGNAVGIKDKNQTEDRRINLLQNTAFTKTFLIKLYFGSLDTTYWLSNFGKIS